MQRLRKFLLNGTLLTIAALLMRSINMSFQVYLSGKLGAAGLGLFSLIMSVFGFSVTVATSGIHHTTMRLIAEAEARGNELELCSAMRHAIRYALIFGFFACILLFSLSSTLATYILRDQRTLRALRLLALSLPFLSVTSGLQGYFHAVRRVAKNVAVQVTDQCFYMTVTVLALLYFSPSDVESACLCIIAGSCLAELYSFSFSLLLYIWDRKHHPLATKSNPPPHMAKRLCGIAIPIALSTYVRSGLMTVEHLLIPRGLRKSGSNADSALASYGVLHGMALPVILFPMALLTSFCGLLVPEFTESQTKGETARIRSVAGSVITITLAFSIGCCILITFFSEQIALYIYHEVEVANYLRLLAPLIPIMYLDHAVDHMLKGLNQQLYSMRVNILDAAISVLLVWLVLPKFGMNGYVFVLYFTECVNAFFSCYRLIRMTHTHCSVISGVLKPCLAGIGATSIANLAFYFLHIICDAKSVLFFQISLTAMLYVLFLLTLHTLRQNGRRWMHAACGHGSFKFCK